MYRYALYTEGDVCEFHTLKDAVSYASYLLLHCQKQSVVIDQKTGKIAHRN